MYYLSSAEKGVSTKLFDKFEGPYKIVEVLSPTVYVLDLECKNKCLPMVHSSQIKVYVPCDPRWKPSLEPNAIPVRKLVKPPLKPTHGRMLKSQTWKLAKK